MISCCGAVVLWCWRSALRALFRFQVEGSGNVGTGAYGRLHVYHVTSIRAARDERGLLLMPPL